MKSVIAPKNRESVTLVIRGDSSGVGQAVVMYGMANKKLPLDRMSITLAAAKKITEPGNKSEPQEAGTKIIGSQQISYSPDFSASISAESREGERFIFLDATTDAKYAWLEKLNDRVAMNEIALDAMVIRREAV
jgi:hypothetical protein